MVMGGGTLPEEDVSELKNGGWAKEIFTPRHHPGDYRGVDQRQRKDRLIVYVAP